MKSENRMPFGHNRPAKTTGTGTAGESRSTPTRRRRQYSSGVHTGIGASRSVSSLARSNEPPPAYRSAPSVRLFTAACHESCNVWSGLGANPNIGRVTAHRPSGCRDIRGFPLTLSTSPGVVAYHKRTPR